MQKVNRALLAIILAGLAASAFAQGRFDDVTIKTHHVRDNVYMLEGEGGNIGVSVGEDGILIIDDQFAPLADKIRAALSDLDKGDLEFVLNTHHHGDHTGGNAVFGKEAHIVAHDNVRKRLAASQNVDKDALPVITFADEVTFHFNGDTIRMIHAPNGHTDTDSIIYFENANVIHMGDHFFADRFPYIDTGAGGDPEHYAENVGHVIREAPEGVKFIPGHGPLAELDDLKKFHAMLTDCIQIVKDQITGGKSLDEIREKGLPAKYDDWGWSFITKERWISILHQGLTD